MVNFIDKYVTFVSEQTDAPLNSILASAFWLVSSTLGLWFDVQETPSLSTRCNLFVLLSGKAGITRKTTVMNYAKSVYKIAWNEFYKKIGIDIDIEDKFCEEFTVEGIADQVDEIYSKGVIDLVLMTDEFGIWLARTGSTHLLGSKGLLSKLYYGESFKQSLSKRGGKKGTRIIPAGLYWTLFGAMQDPEMYLTDVDIRQGFLRRFLFIYVKDDDLREYKPPLSSHRRFIKQKLVMFGKELAERMYSFYKISGGLDPISTFFSQSVVDSINNYDLENYKNIREIYSTESLVSGYMSTAWEHVLKLTVLRSIADYDTKPIVIVNEPVYNVTDLSHFEYCRAWFDKIKTRMIEAIERIAVGKENPILPDIANVADQIIGVISREGGSITTGELLTKLGTTKMKIKDYIVTLVEQGKLVPVFDYNKRWFIKLFINKTDAEKYVTSRAITGSNNKPRILDYKTFESVW